MTTTTVPAQQVRASTGRQLGGWAGVVGTVLFVALGLTIFDGPSLGDPATEMRQWFADNESTVALFTWALPAVMILFLVFASALRGMLDEADGRTAGVLSRASFALAAAMVATGLVGLAFWGVLAQENVLSAVSDDTVVAIASLDTMLFFAIIPWLDAAFLACVSIVIIQSGVMPKWLGWLGCVAAVAAALSGLWVFSGDPGNFFGAGLGTVAFLGSRAWTLLAAAFLIRSREIDLAH